MRLSGTFTASQLQGVETAIQLQNRNDGGAPKTSGFISVSSKEIIHRHKMSIVQDETEIGWYQEKQYNWSPWCIVKTDHFYYLQIETIDHPDNNYNAGKRRYPYEKATFNHWKYIFTGELEPVRQLSLHEIMEIQ